MTRIGKWPENKIYFRDVTSGRRGIQWSQGRRDGLYRLCWFGRVTMPARGTATNIGGSARYQRTAGGNIGGNAVGARMGSYCSSVWGHGLDNVVGAFAIRRYGSGGGATVQPTALACSILNATSIRVVIEGYTAATVTLNLFAWGATSALY